MKIQVSHMVQKPALSDFKKALLRKHTMRLSEDRAPYQNTISTSTGVTKSQIAMK